MPHHRIAVLLGTAALALHLGFASAAPPPSMAQAQRAYYQGHYAHSLALFVQLADAHDAEAAECAGIMLLLGEPEFGPQVRRNLPRAKALLLQAARAGRVGAGTLLNMVERTD